MSVPSLAVRVRSLHPPRIVVVLCAATVFTLALSPGIAPERFATFLSAVLLTQLAISLHEEWSDRRSATRTVGSGSRGHGTLGRRRTLLLALGAGATGSMAAGALDQTVSVLLALNLGAGFAYNVALRGTLWSWVPCAIALPTVLACAAVMGSRFLLPYLVAYALAVPLVLAVNLANNLADAERRSSTAGSMAQRLGWRRARSATWIAVAFALTLEIVARPERTITAITFAAVALLAAAVLAQGRPHRLHALLVLAACVAIAFDWLFVVAYLPHELSNDPLT